MKKNKFIIKLTLSIFLIVSLFLLKDIIFDKPNILANDEFVDLIVFVSPPGAGEVNINVDETQIENALGLVSKLNVLSSGDTITATIPEDGIYPEFSFAFWSIGYTAFDPEDDWIDEEITGSTINILIPDNVSKITLVAYFEVDQDFLKKLFPKYPDRLSYILSEINEISHQIEISGNNINSSLSGCSCNNMQSLCLPTSPRIGSSSGSINPVGAFGDPCSPESRKIITSERKNLEANEIRLHYFNSLIEQEIEFLDTEKKTLTEEQGDQLDVILNNSQNIITNLIEANSGLLGASIFNPLDSNCSARCQHNISLSYSIVACIGIGSGEQKPIKLNWLVSIFLQDLDLGAFRISGMQFNFPNHINIGDANIKSADFYMQATSLVVRFPEINLANVSAGSVAPSFDFDLNVSSTTGHTIEFDDQTFSVDSFFNPITRFNEISEQMFHIEVDQRWYWEIFGWLFDRCFNELHKDFFYSTKDQDDSPTAADPGLTCNNRMEIRERINLLPCTYIENETNHNNCLSLLEEEPLNYNLLRGYCNNAFYTNTLINSCRDGISLLECLNNDSAENCYNLHTRYSECTNECLEIRNYCNTLNNQDNIEACENDLSICYYLYDSVDEDLLSGQWSTGSNVGFCSNIEPNEEVSPREPEVAEYTFSDCKRLWQISWLRYWPQFRFGHRSHEANVTTTNYDTRHYSFNNHSNYLTLRTTRYYRNIIEGLPLEPASPDDVDSYRLRRIINDFFGQSPATIEIGLPNVCLSETEGIDRPELRSAMAFERECKKLLGDVPECQLTIRCTIPKTKWFWPHYFYYARGVLGHNNFNSFGHGINMGIHLTSDIRHQEIFTTTNVADITEPEIIIQGNPIDLAVDSLGNIWVVNESHGSVSKINSTNVNQIGRWATGSGPVSVAIDSQDNVWVINKEDNNIVKLNNLGQELGRYNINNNSLDLVIDSQNNVWIISLGQENINGEFENFNLLKINNIGEVQGTYDIAPYPVNIIRDSQDNIWVTSLGQKNINGEFENFNLLKINNIGEVQGTYDIAPYPGGIAADSQDNIWVTSSADGTVLKISFEEIIDNTDPDNPIITINVSRNTYNAGDSPGSIAIDPQDNVWIANFISEYNDDEEEWEDNSRITILNNSGNTIATYTHNNYIISPIAIAIDLSGRGWVANYQSHSITRINRITNAMSNLSLSMTVEHSPFDDEEQAFTLYYPPVNCYTVNQPGYEKCQDIYCDLSGTGISTTNYNIGSNSMGFSQGCNTFYIREHWWRRVRWGWWWSGWRWVYQGQRWMGPFNLDKHFLEDYLTKEIAAKYTNSGLTTFCRPDQASIDRIKGAMWGAVVPDLSEEGRCEELLEEQKSITPQQYKEKSLDNLIAVITLLIDNPELQKAPLNLTEISVCSSKYSEPKDAIAIRCRELVEGGETPLPEQCHVSYGAGTQNNCETLLGNLNINLSNINNNNRDDFLTYGTPEKALEILCKEHNLTEENLCFVVDPPPDSCIFFHLLTEGQYRDKPDIDFNFNPGLSDYLIQQPQSTYSPSSGDSRISDFEFKSAPVLSFPAIRIPSIKGPRFTLMPFFDIKLPGFIFEDLVIPDIPLCDLSGCGDFFPLLNIIPPTLEIPKIELDPVTADIPLEIDIEGDPGNFDGGTYRFDPPTIKPNIDMPAFDFDPGRLPNLLNFAEPIMSFDSPSFPRLSVNISFGGISIDWRSFLAGFIKALFGSRGSFCFSASIGLHGLPVRIWFEDFIFSWPSFPTIPDFCEVPREFCKQVRETMHSYVGNIERAISSGMEGIADNFQSMADNFHQQALALLTGQNIYGPIIEHLNAVLSSLNNQISSQTIGEGTSFTFHHEYLAVPVTISIRNGILSISPLAITIPREIASQVSERLRLLFETLDANLSLGIDLDLPSLNIPGELYRFDLPSIPLSDLSYSKRFSINIPGFQMPRLQFSLSKTGFSDYTADTPSGSPGFYLNFDLGTLADIQQETITISEDFFELKTF